MPSREAAWHNSGHGERSSVGRAPDCGLGGRGFKSPRSPHLPSLDYASAEPAHAGSICFRGRRLSRRRQDVIAWRLSLHLRITRLTLSPTMAAAAALATQTTWMCAGLRRIGPLIGGQTIAMPKYSHGSFVTRDRHIDSAAASPPKVATVADLVGDAATRLRGCSRRQRGRSPARLRRRRTRWRRGRSGAPTRPSRRAAAGRRWSRGEDAALHRFLFWPLRLYNQRNRNHPALNLETYTVFH